MPSSPRHPRIELLWPDKGRVPEHDDSGRWHTSEPDAATRQTFPLLPVSRHGADTVPSLVISGARLRALAAVRRLAAGAARLMYVDLPRIEGFDETRAFQGEAGHVWSTWLSVAREHIVAALPLIAPQGVLVVQAGDLEEAFAKVLLFELVGRENYLGSIVWHSHYSPKGGKETVEIAPCHETLLCFAMDRSRIRPIALSRPVAGFSNPDGDPRGPWQAKQKDAGRDTVKITYNVPPYRWATCDPLPPGLWRVSPFSGVVWGTPTTPGEYPVEVTVTDSANQQACHRFTFRVAGSGQPPALPTEAWWVRAPPRPSDRPPAIDGAEPPTAVVGHMFSFVLRASGGQPYQGTPRPSRGWGFGQATLDCAIIKDTCHFGRKGDAIPEPKKRPPPDGETSINVTSWWDGADAGWSQDATKHLNWLREQGLIEDGLATAKPEKLLGRVLECFTKPGEVVVELFARTGDFAAAATKLDRRFLAFVGDAADGASIWQRCMRPRLDAIINGKNVELDQVAVASDTGDAVGNARGYHHYKVATAFATRMDHDSSPHLDYASYAGDSLGQAILTTEGYLPVPFGTAVCGVSLDQRAHAIVLGPSEFLDAARLSKILANAQSKGERTVVYFFRSDGDITVSDAAQWLVLKRVPMDLSM